jgi:hypothetical protein
MNDLITAEYNGVPFSFQPDGWFNATLAAKRYGKQPKEWLRLDETNEYIAALSQLSNGGQNPIWHKTKRGNNGGTWLHPKLAVRFAQWLDARFAVWCDMQIDAILRPANPANDADAISTVNDRSGLLLSAVFSVIRHRLGFGTVYQAFNSAAGSDHFRHMTKAQVRQAEPVAHRIANGAATEQDWQLIESNRADKPAAPQQHQLSFSSTDAAVSK